MEKKKLFELFPKVNIKDKEKSYFDNAIISSINIVNEEKKIDIVLLANSLIPKDLLLYVMEIIKTTYKINSLEIKVKYDKLEGTIEDIISSYCGSIISYINAVMPFSRGVLTDSKWEIEDKVLRVNLKSIGANLLKSKKCNDLISKILNDEFGIKVKVEIVDPIFSKEDKEKHVERKNNENSKIVRETLINTFIAPEPELKQSKEGSIPESKQDSEIILGKTFNGEVIQINEITDELGKMIVEGDIVSTSERELKGGKILYMFGITNYKNSMTCKCFLEKKEFEEVSGRIKHGIRVRVQGDIIFDQYSKETVMMSKNIIEVPRKFRKDNNPNKRVELHVHTKMSAMDAVTSAKDIIKTAAKWGHRAIAITDHGVVQAFPDALHASEDLDIKVIYGVEAYIVDDKAPIAQNADGRDLNSSFVVFDIETTGFYCESDRITEIGAVKVVNGEIVDQFSTFVNPQKPIPSKITEITGITNSMVSDAKIIDEILPKFLEFAGDSVLVAHNANFDMSFIRYNARRMSINIDNPVLDTLELSRSLLSELKRHKLDVICKHLGICLENHHRALDDAMATAHMFLKFKDMLEEKNIFTLQDINEKLKGIVHFSKLKTYHAIILVKNYVGLKNLYKLISESHLNYFYKKPRIPKSLYNQYKDGLIIGSACEAGELYKSIIENKDSSEIKKIVNFYDYLEIQPIINNMFLVENGAVESADSLKEINKKIIKLGEKYNKPVVATCDVHYLNPEDDIFRRILMAGQGFEDANKEQQLYLRTTDEMLDEFSYLGEDKAYEVVVENTNRISDMIEKISPISPDKCPPIIDGSEEDLRRICYEKAVSIYGEDLPQIVKDRLEKELNSIIGNGYAVMYIIAQKLVWKSMEDGYLVGSRGSVGSSFAATMSGITEVNPLPPHYICKNCKHAEFILDGSIGSGFDLPKKDCPKCGAKMFGEGQDIPFETFLGFDGDKEPDIDLNFSGEYQSKAHDYTEQLFGKGKAYRAGTIGTLAEKTAFGFVKKYLDEQNKVANSAEINRLVLGCTGVRRTSGQHPGGIIVLPADRDIYDFCPIQWPANDNTASLEITHFDYHSIDRNLLKLDILGHDDPTAIRMLEDLTGLNATEIDLGDKEVLKLFITPTVMGIKREDIKSEVGSFAIPEFGTKFVRQMLIDTQPTTFSELVIISGLSHGTDVWLNNAQELVRNGVCKLSEVISTRDGIMTYLIYQGLPPKQAFSIMEPVRKGKGLKPEQEDLMRDYDVPEWYIESCNKIKYMFPKAHAAAYVTMAVRIAHFKLYYPEAFYATYYTVRADDFDANIMIYGREKVQFNINELESRGNTISTKEKNVLTILEVANEMYCRGIKFTPIDIYKSDSKKFTITPEGILPPLNALSGLGLNAAENIVESRIDGEFISKEDLQMRAKISKTVVENLAQNGCLKGLPDSNQISLFG